jgi:hypothetical protein
MFRSVDNHLQKDLFVIMLETAITIKLNNMETIYNI